MKTRRLFRLEEASYYADTLCLWDKEHFVTTLNGRVLWESACHTRRGGAIRLMRMDNGTLRVYRAYVPLKTPMRLVAKESKSFDGR